MDEWVRLLESAYKRDRMSVIERERERERERVRVRECVCVREREDVCE